MKTNLHVEVKASKHNSGKNVVSMVDIGDSTVLLFCEDNSLKSFKVFENGETKNWKNLGYLCPYCLIVCPSYSAMFIKHMSVHLGPALCRSCQVFSLINL